MTTTQLATWLIAGLATAGVIVRPWRLPEAVWAVLGAVLLVALDLLPWHQALRGIANGTDVYLFLIGMMLLSEVARREGLFDRAAALAVNHAGHSRLRLFALIYAVGIVVTAFLSNDATAVVLTPAVYAATRKARVDALPYLFICALVANAASFILPISNPANIVLYGDHTPPLLAWLSRFTLASLAAVVMTFLSLWWTQAGALKGRCESNAAVDPMSAGAWTALAGIGLTAVALLTCSALDRHLGLPTFTMGVLTAAAVLVRKRQGPRALLSEISWSVIPLVAGLFVLVEAMTATGVTTWLAQMLHTAAATHQTATAAGAGGILAIACNLMNNLPAGLITSAAIAQAHPPQTVIDALLIGVDLGPNFSITGSLATILWLTAIRREGEDVDFWKFLKTGLLVTPLPLALALLARVAFA